MRRHLTPVRGEILTTLKKRGELTAGELACCMKVTPTAVRQQLSYLEAADLVARRLQRRPIGRPTTMYLLTHEADELFPKSYDDLATSLLRLIAEIDGEEKVREIFRVRAVHLEEQYRPALAGKSLGQRVETLAAILNEGGALAEWAAVDGGFELIGYNCILAKVSASFPQACAEELSLLSRVLETEVVRVEHMASGDRCCRYCIRASA